jgi:hypothetical protein
MAAQYLREAPPAQAAACWTSLRPEKPVPLDRLAAAIRAKLAERAP